MDSEIMMACSYLSANGMRQAAGAACWTPPSMACLTPEMEGPSGMQSPMFLRPPPTSQHRAPIAAAQCSVAPRTLPEPALDLTTSSLTLKSRLPSPQSDDEVE